MVQWSRGDIMRSKTGRIITNIALYIIFAALGCGIACASLIFFMVDGFVNQFGDGVLKAVFVTIYLCAIAATIAICKKKKVGLALPPCLTLAALSAVMVNGIIYNAAGLYSSVYSREKWDENEEIRFYMIDDLEKKYDFVGMTKDKVIEILGEPDTVSEYGGWEVFDYYLGYGDDMIDPYTYNVRFEDGIAVYADRKNN